MKVSNETNVFSSHVTVNTEEKAKAVYIKFLVALAKSAHETRFTSLPLDSLVTNYSMNFSAFII